MVNVAADTLFHCTHRHFLCEPGFAGCLPIFLIHLFPKLCILLGQARTLHMLLDMVLFPVFLIPFSIIMQCFVQFHYYVQDVFRNYLNSVSSSLEN